MSQLKEYSVTTYLIIGQIISYVISYGNSHIAAMLPLSGVLVQSGEWWRLVTYIITPVSDSPIFVAFTWYFLYMYGSMIERQWGARTYLQYLAISYIGGIIASFLFPQLIITNGYLYASCFFAFATMFPEMQILLFFIIPVKIKWLGFIGALGLISTLVFGSLSEKVYLLFCFSNYLYFFGRDILAWGKNVRRAQTISSEIQPHTIINRCTTCGKDEKTDRLEDFRFCTDCEPPHCYCEEHINLHRHKKAPVKKRTVH